jgi:L-lactate dehydrogenase complex protein LldF
LAGEKPSHITAPALHKSAKEIYNLLNEKYEQNFNESTPVEIVVSFVRNLLREEFMQCQVGITGANFIVADPGLIAITENEGNALLSSSSQVLIVVTTIEKLIPSLQNLELFQTMLSSHGTGQKITAYNHLISGPAKQKENQVHHRFI